MRNKFNPYLNPNDDLNNNPNMSIPENSPNMNPGQAFIPDNKVYAQPFRPLPNQFTGNKLVNTSPTNQIPQPTIPRPFTPPSDPYMDFINHERDMYKNRIDFSKFIPDNNMPNPPVMNNNLSRFYDSLNRNQLQQTSPQQQQNRFANIKKVVGSKV